MLKEDDLPPHLRSHETQQQPVLEAELPLEAPLEAIVEVPATEEPPDPYLRTS